MLLGITRPGWGCESLPGHHEQLLEFASRDSLLVGRNFPVSEFRETRREGPREGAGLENLAHPEAGFGRIPCISPVDPRISARETGSRSTARTAIQSAVVETSRPHSGTA